jgi:hypothetical protein
VDLQAAGSSINTELLYHHRNAPAIKVDNVAVSKVGVDQVTPSHVGNSHVAVVLQDSTAQRSTA